jgi:hypothetical protein
VNLEFLASRLCRNRFVGETSHSLDYQAKTLNYQTRMLQARRVGKDRPGAPRQNDQGWERRAKREMEPAEADSIGNDEMQS